MPIVNLPFGRSRKKSSGEISSFLASFKVPPSRFIDGADDVSKVARLGEICFTFEKSAESSAMEIWGSRPRTAR